MNPKIMNKETILITGASSGIGFHIAKECAQHGHRLVLVASNEDELNAIAADLSTEYHVKVLPLAKDLRDPNAAAEIREELGSIAVDILVNNAGHGKKGKFWEIAQEEDISMLHLNIEAVVRMTKTFLPQMLAGNKGRILNTASVAGFEPGPGYVIYSSTKAFVLSFTEALATELENTEITVTALCPGPTDTDFFPKADMLSTQAFQKGNLMAPQDVAKAAYEGLMAGERLVIPGALNKAMVFMRRLIPISLQAKINDLMTSDVKPGEEKRDRGAKEFAGKVTPLSTPAFDK